MYVLLWLPIMDFLIKKSVFSNCLRHCQSVWQNSWKKAKILVFVNCFLFSFQGWSRVTQLLYLSVFSYHLSSAHLLSYPWNYQEFLPTSVLVSSSPCQTFSCEGNYQCGKMGLKFERLAAFSVWRLLDVGCCVAWRMCQISEINIRILGIISLQSKMKHLSSFSRWLILFTETFMSRWLLMLRFNLGACE